MLSKSDAIRKIVPIDLIVNGKKKIIEIIEINSDVNCDDLKCVPRDLIQRQMF